MNHSKKPNIANISNEVFQMKLLQETEHQTDF
jgi:hypothetical protein